MEGGGDEEDEPEQAHENEGARSRSVLTNYSSEGPWDTEVESGCSLGQEAPLDTKNGPAELLGDHQHELRRRSL